MNKSRLKVKDIITVTLLSLCNILIFALGTLMYVTPITILLTPVLYSLLQGIVFFVIGVKVQKKGAFFIYSLIKNYKLKCSAIVLKACTGKKDRAATMKITTNVIIPKVSVSVFSVPALSGMNFF